MSVWPSSEYAPGLRGAEGILLSIRVSVEPRLLEELLEALAEVPFPVNPEIHHPLAVPAGERSRTIVEFPAYETRLAEVRETLRRHGFDPDSARVASMLEEIQGRPARDWRS
ncbi:MAG: hypothetical protein HY822_10015 [Acidobacteria bacterium]|nr:hypothetical protein [Acidobacteriota bacterium]